MNSQPKSFQSLGLSNLYGRLAALSPLGVYSDAANLLTQVLPYIGSSGALSHMVTRRRAVPRRAKKTGKKAKQTKPSKAVHARKKVEIKKPPSAPSPVVQPPLGGERPARERSRIAVEYIHGNTVIGDLLVTFPQTRTVLARKGLRLEAEDAGDIYLTLDAFSAMNGLKTESVIQELVEVTKERPSVSQLVETPAA